ncbi:unnamed protein product [Vitrella brassicaformis CCMP3155]|uniref:Uncharacterized protein n=1 Tax=Vitrella brassicaformis (strain CCMP3155) TaxID=1169540 RepID=A0A0G4E972_VITBC|nr:unnamed protein product [Vitrella brassicaformis CCMP3155]|eukprot:CEL91768.1 unnamed protein product [Vitrella brassicaformis CCMP3155]
MEKTADSSIDRPDRGRKRKGNRNPKSRQQRRKEKRLRLKKEQTEESTKDEKAAPVAESVSEGVDNRPDLIGRSSSRNSMFVADGYKSHDKEQPAIAGLNQISNDSSKFLMPDVDLIARDSSNSNMFVSDGYKSHHDKAMQEQTAIAVPSSSSSSKWEGKHEEPYSDAARSGVGVQGR